VHALQCKPTINLRVKGKQLAYMHQHSASEMTYIVSSGALNSTHSLMHQHQHIPATN